MRATYASDSDGELGDKNEDVKDNFADEVLTNLDTLGKATRYNSQGINILQLPKADDLYKR
jgi:hypothetical protein